ncbi:mitochondrial and cytoplasmic histidine-tRNA ligase Hrs1 [Myxozyma melibiosi]|uniref:histidine--tRNA ligase n=1 Tax=Myxozyma melibiosi TaxID=54550 RepID=A0ABR1FB65_9ASCO
MLLFSRTNSSVCSQLIRKGLQRSLFSAMASTEETQVAAAPVVRKEKEKKEKVQQYTLKTPKGTKDWADKDMVLRTRIFDTLTAVFKRHGGVTIDTPVFELREILAGKYGEDSKLIYDLKDQGGELCSLRYDLTVPFARFLAMNPTIQSIKRYHIAKVYRRDQPAMTKGRMREFYQCDFDIAGTYETMVPDAEAVAIAVEGLTELGIEEFTVKLNHRKILDGIFAVCGVPEADVRKISSAVDKLDKVSWEDVKKEMVEEKNLPVEAADKIGEYVKLKGGRDLIATLESDGKLMANESAAQGVKDMVLLYDYLDAFEASSKVSFDLSLARGLDYYTGIIYECVTTGSAPPPAPTEEAASSKKSSKKSKPKDEDEDVSEYVGIGSIAAGGRYDELVGMFAQSKKKSVMPCVGISFGVERLFSILKAKEDMSKVRATATDVYIMAFGGGKEWTGFLPERMKVARSLWKAGISAEYLYKSKPKPRQQFEAADKIGAPLAVILGQDEYSQGKVKVKQLGLGDNADEGIDVALEDLAEYVKKQLTIV